MEKKYLYQSAALHIAVFLLCVFDIPYFSSKISFEEQPIILVDLDDVVISDTTNLPELAVRGKERKPATRKEKPQAETAAPKPKLPETQTKEEPTPEPTVDAPEIKAPSLIEEAPKMEESVSEPRKEEKKKPVEKKKPAPIPQKKPQVKPNKKPETPKKPAPNNKPTKTADPLQSLMNSVDDLQRQIGEEDAPAQVRYDEQVNNMGIEGGNSKGSYFSELSVSGIDYVKSKIQENWKTIAGGKDDRNIEVVINVKLTKEGGIQSVEVEDMRRYRSDNYFSALADSAERAIRIADEVHNVFSVLAKQNGSRYNEWKEIRFSFTPLGLSR